MGQLSRVCIHGQAQGQHQCSMPGPAVSVWPRLRAGISSSSSVGEGKNRCALALGLTGLWMPLGTGSWGMSDTQSPRHIRSCGAQPHSLGLQAGYLSSLVPQEMVISAGGPQRGPPKRRTNGGDLAS